MTETKKGVGGETFTTEKREDGFFLRQSEFNYDSGRRTGLKRDAIYIELNRGVQFDPKAFLSTFKGYGWKEGEVMKLLPDLIRDLDRRADDRSTKTCRWRNRIRPDAQVRLEGENEDLREILSGKDSMIGLLDSVIEKAAKTNPEILELKKKVLGEAFQG